MPLRTAVLRSSPAATRPITAQAVWLGGRGPTARLARVGRSWRCSRPSRRRAFWCVEQPAHGAAHVRRGHVLADAGHPAQHLPGAVDVVDAPAAVPGAVARSGRGAGTAARARPPDGGRRTREVAQALEHAAGDVGASWDRSSRCGRRTAPGSARPCRCRDRSGPAAVAVLHPEHPGEAARDRRRLRRLAVASARAWRSTISAMQVSSTSG